MRYIINDNREVQDIECGLSFSVKDRADVYRWTKMRRGPWRKLELTRANDIPLSAWQPLLRGPFNFPSPTNITELLPGSQQVTLRITILPPTWQFKGPSRPSFGIRRYCERPDSIGLRSWTDNLLIATGFSFRFQL